MTSSTHLQHAARSTSRLARRLQIHDGRRLLREQRVLFEELRRELREERAAGVEVVRKRRCVLHAHEDPADPRSIPVAFGNFQEFSGSVRAASFDEAFDAARA